MSDELHEVDELKDLVRAARQLVEGEMLLGGTFLPASASGLAVDGTSTSGDGTKMNRSALGATPNRLAVDGTSTSGDVASTSNSPPTTPQDKALALDELRARCVKCLGCLLNKTRTNLVFGEGNPAAELVFVGEAPGEDEDRTGRPFVGRAGQKLTEMIQAMGLRREDVYICNLLKCRPPNNRPPAPEEVQACWPYLVRQLQIIRPKVIVTLGNPATQNLLGTTIGITKIRGNWQKLPDLAPGLGGTAVMPTFHPSYLIRSYTIENRHAVWSDIQKVMERLGLKRK